jgi:two-component system sensor histidine kinase KdpD
MIEQILQNLIYNAIVHTPVNTKITIEAQYTDDALKLRIADNGVGFPQAEIQNIFNKFYRLNHSNPGGTGLGLSIVKGFTEVLNGKIKLENLRTGGALFTITIPAESSAYNETDHE